MTGEGGGRAPRAGARLETGHAELTWSADGRAVTKRATLDFTDAVLGTGKRAFLNEWRVNQLLVRHPPPVPAPRLLAADRQRRALVFEAVDGDPLGPKFPPSLAEGDVLAGLDLARALGPYRPRRRGLRRLRLAHRLALHRAEGLLDGAEAAVLARAAALERGRWRFAHADITARNVLRERPSGRLVLIDWEWAGLYPPSYDLAMFWFCLADAPGARALVEARLRPTERRGFLLSAALVHLLHLHMWRTRRRPVPWWDRHEATLRRLLRELGSTQVR